MIPTELDDFVVPDVSIVQAGKLKVDEDVFHWTAVSFESGLPF